MLTLYTGRTFTVAKIHSYWDLQWETLTFLFTRVFSGFLANFFKSITLVLFMSFQCNAKSRGLFFLLCFETGSDSGDISKQKNCFIPVRKCSLDINDFLEILRKNINMATLRKKYIPALACYIIFFLQ